MGDLTVKVVKAHFKCPCGNSEPIKLHGYREKLYKSHYTFVCKECGFYLDTYDINQIYSLLERDETYDNYWE